MHSVKQQVDVDFQRTVIDVLGIGFGPSNISIAIALKEVFPKCQAVFVEKSKEFSWHKGMLFEDATMQVNFLKDLVSFRNPRSKFTFINFLYEKNRLVDFSNLQKLFPTRVEFHQYLQWCADHFNNVLYSHIVHDISIETYNGEKIFRVSIDGAEGATIIRARTIIHGAGLEPNIPFSVLPSERIIHGYDILEEIKKNTPDASYVVVGAGQSAAEVVKYLYKSRNSASVTAVLSRFGYMPADDSAFVNQIFDPEHVDTFYNASTSSRKCLLDMHSLTNYSAVDINLIDELYSLWYQERVLNQNRFRIFRMSRVVSAVSNAKGVSVTLECAVQGTQSTLETDYLICATGFHSRSVIDLLSDDLKSLIKRDVNGKPSFERDYSLSITGLPKLIIFAPDMCEETHGLTSTLISNMATRAGEIANSLKKLLSKSDEFSYEHSLKEGGAY